ncbi:MAG: hypothetical protein IJ741_07075 [Schwartzia sp.]|nr:hypothetical protein [Schwartzia sp. (in: firmicutes)]
MKYKLRVYVTMGGDIEVEAANEDEAIEIAKGKQFVSSDLRNFVWYGNEVDDSDVEEVED